MKKLSNLEFIERSKLIHSNLYDYSKTRYIGMKYKVTIICNIHGEFWTNPGDHINKRRGCPKCSMNYKDDLISFTSKANKIHSNKYLYNEYINSFTKIKIICPEHGEFFQTPNNHINLKNGCPECKKVKLNLLNKNKNYIKDFILVHGDKYDYSKVKYINNKTSVEIICPKHGKFFQTPSRHFNNGQGCPKCHVSKGELQIIKYFEENNIEYESQKRFDACRNTRTLPFDFYIPSINTCIEYDGEQHFKSIDFFGGVKNLKQIQKNDCIKNSFCKTNGIELLRIAFNEDCLKKIKNFYSKKITTITNN